MTREEQIEQKAKELGQKYFPNENNIFARPNYEAKCVEFACKEMMEWADSHLNHWHDAQGDDLPEDRQHCLIHYGGTKYCDFELAFFNAADECFVTCSYPHPTGQSVISPGCDNDVLTDVYKNKRDKVSIKEIERWCVLEDILPK